MCSKCGQKKAESAEQRMGLLGPTDCKPCQMLYRYRILLFVLLSVAGFMLFKHLKGSE